MNIFLTGRKDKYKPADSRAKSGMAILSALNFSKASVTICLTACRHYNKGTIITGTWSVKPHS